MAIRANNSSDRFGRSAARNALGLVPLVLGGFLMVVAVSSSSKFPWLGWLALIPLLRAVQVRSALLASISGGVWGLSIALFARWFGQSGFVASAIGMLLLSLLPGLYAYVGARVTRRVGFNPLVLAVCWMPIELLLQPLGLQHGLLASTQSDGILLRVVGHFFGYVVVAFVLAFSGALLLAALTAVRFRLPRLSWRVGIDEAGGVLWVPIALREPVFRPCPLQPRAPPFGLA